LATTRRHEYHKEAREEEERRRGKQEIRSVGVVEDRTQPVEEARAATPSSSPERTRKMKIKSIGERSHVRKPSRTINALSKYATTQAISLK
jgi:hypothetical protein